MMLRYGTEVSQIVNMFVKPKQQLKERNIRHVKAPEIRFQPPCQQVLVIVECKIEYLHNIYGNFQNYGLQ